MAAIGPLGEQIAQKYLQDRRYKIIKTNYWKPQGEIDIIAEKNGSIHFIEVKAVTWDFSQKTVDARGIRPEENLHKNKLKRLFRAIQIYLIEYDLSQNTAWQIDAIFVFIDQKNKRSAVEYYEHISIE